MKTKEIRDLIDFISETGLNEVNIETEELKLSVKRSADIQQVAAAPVSIQAPAVAAPSAALQAESSAPATSDNANYIEVKSPMIGTYYRSANPESAPFVNVGDSISAGQTVCIVEAMKLMNEIKSEVKGKVVDIPVDNAQPVEFGQTLFTVEPQ